MKKPCRAVGSLAPLELSASVRYFHILEQLVQKHRAFSPETIAALAGRETPINPFALERGVLREVAEYPYRATFDRLLGEGLNWPWLREEIARFSHADEEEAKKRHDASTGTAPIFHVGKPVADLLPEAIPGFAPERLGSVRDARGKLWVSVVVQPESVVGPRTHKFVETESKHTFTLPPGVIRSQLVTSVDGEARAIAHRKDRATKAESIEIYDPKTGAVLRRVELDDYPVLSGPAGKSTGRQNFLGHFGPFFSFFRTGPDGREKLVTVCQDAPTNQDALRLVVSSIDLATGARTPVVQPPQGAFRFVPSRDGRDVYAIGLAGQKGEAGDLVVTSLATGRVLLRTPRGPLVGRLDQMFTFYESSGGELYVASHETSDGHAGLRFHDIARHKDVFVPLEGADETSPGFFENREGGVSFVAPPTTGAMTILHPFTGAPAQTIALTHDISGAHPQIRRTPDGKTFLAAQTWSHVDPTKPNHLFLYDLDGHVGMRQDLGRMGLRGLVGLVDESDGGVHGLFAQPGQAPETTVFSSVPLYGVPAK